MVKNKKGGSGHKRMAKKHAGDDTFRQRKLREPNKGELFACVTRVNGGNVFEVLCNDKVNRQMIVRKKFRGRNKRHNAISVGTIVIVGLREWEVLSLKRKEKVDLLEVYNQGQMDQLKMLKSLNKEILPEKEVVNEDDSFMIDTDNIFIDENIQQELNNNINKKLTIQEEQNDEEKDVDIDWDDI